jgi:formylglycine-generating enzyme required for sulfatase activity
MNTRPSHLICLLTTSFLLALHCNNATAQETRFFRLSGPTITTITAWRLDGTIVWSNAAPGATYTFQIASFLAGGTNWVDYVQIPVTQAVNTNLLVAFNPPAGMTLIPAGVFTMGNYLINGNSITNDPDITDAIPTNIYVSAFYMDVNLVSYSQWQAVYSYATNHGYGFGDPGAGKAADHPVQTVSWYDAVKWSNARSQQAGLTPVYYTDALFTQVYTNGGAPYANWSVNGYRLPTEAEWEKAARGGLSGQRFPWGNTISWNQANYLSSPPVALGGLVYDLSTPNNSYDAAFAIGEFPYTSPAGSFRANGYGLNDMAGNVLEWCWDWYGAYGQPTNINPTGATIGTYHVLRGGLWYSYADLARCANRTTSAFFLNPYFPSYHVGFRCVRGL